MSNKEREARGRRLGLFRKAQGQGVNEFIEGLNISNATYSRYENGHNEFSIDFIIRLHKVHKCSIMWLLFDVGEMIYEPDMETPNNAYCKYVEMLEKNNDALIKSNHFYEKEIERLKRLLDVKIGARG